MTDGTKSLILDSCNPDAPGLVKQMEGLNTEGNDSDNVADMECNGDREKGDVVDSKANCDSFDNEVDKKDMSVCDGSGEPSGPAGEDKMCVNNVAEMRASPGISHSSPQLHRGGSSGILKHPLVQQHSMERMRYDRLVGMGVDGSSHSDYALEYYLHNLHQDGNFVILIHSFELPMAYSYQEVYSSPEMIKVAMKRESDKLAHLEERLKAKLDDYEVPGKFIAKGGKAGEVIVKTAEEEDTDLIVVGTRGHGKLRRTIMGSVSSYVVHHAHCPVTVCRPKVMRSRTSSLGSVSKRPDLHHLKINFRKRCNSESSKDAEAKKAGLNTHHVTFADPKDLPDDEEKK